METDIKRMSASFKVSDAWNAMMAKTRCHPLIAHGAWMAALREVRRRSPELGDDDLDALAADLVPAMCDRMVAEVHEREAADRRRFAEDAAQLLPRQFRGAREAVSLAWCMLGNVRSLTPCAAKDKVAKDLSELIALLDVDDDERPDDSINAFSEAALAGYERGTEETMERIMKTVHN